MGLNLRSRGSRTTCVGSEGGLVRGEGRRVKDKTVVYSLCVRVITPEPGNGEGGRGTTSIV